MATFLLIPGAGGDPTYWYRVAPLLVAAGHRVVAVDLPHVDGTTLSDQVDAAVVAGVRAERPLVVVAQSMGAQIAPAVCDRLPVDLLVYLNAMIPTVGESAGDWWGAVGQQPAARAAAVRDGRDPDAPFDPAVGFFHDLPAEVVAHLLSGAERPPAASLFAAPAPMRDHPAVPTRVLAGRDDRLLPAELQQRVARDRLGLPADVLPGGHLLALSRPAELVDRLLGYLEQI